MKLLLILCCFGFINHSSTLIVLIDKDLKKPARVAESFSLEQYFQKTFPIYAADLDAVADAAENVAKKINRGVACYTTDTVTANRSCFMIYTDCEEGKEVTVRLTTKTDEATVDFVLLNKETSMRKAQEKLLNFAAYLKK